MDGYLLFKCLLSYVASYGKNVEAYFWDTHVANASDKLFD